MPKILNLDKLSAKPNDRFIEVKGVQYPIPPMTIDNFIETTLAAERLEGSVSLADQIKSTIDMICRAVPTLPREALGGYPLEILTDIASFIGGADVDDAEEKLAQAQAAIAEREAGK